MMIFSQVGFFAGGLAQYLIPFIFVLTIVVFFHELGHFLVGRLCGVKVDAFSIGFGPELFHWQDRHGTRWRCAIIPLGGYVKFHGDLNGASVPDVALLRSLPPGERNRSFYAQPVWKRAAIVAAGPVASFLFAAVVFSITFYCFGLQTVAPRVKAVIPQSAAEAAGFMPGDLVLSAGGRPIGSFSDIQNVVSMSAGEPLVFEVQRGGSVVRLAATPRNESVEKPFKHNEARLGIQASDAPDDVRQERVSPVRAVGLGAYQTWDLLERTATVLGRLVTGREDANQVSGPIGIATVSGEMAKIGFSTLLNWAAILSASIGFFNLIPIPLLDGGHLLYYILEAVRGRPLSPRAQEMGFRIGLAIVVLLMVFATSNDIMRLVPKLRLIAG
jgi:regulator of sigma E protease